MTSREKTEIGVFPPDADPLVGVVLDGRYRLVRHLGSGQMARVYVAQQLSMSRNVAVKLLLPDLEVDESAVGRFIQEVEVTARLTSPHTISFHDCGKTREGSFYIVMEFLPGETLRDRLDREVQVPPLEVISIVRQVCCSLQEAHDANVLHRDLKPENIHFCARVTPLRPFVKVLDFGLAKLIDPGPDSPELTGRRQTVGTPAYISPELVVEEREVDHRSDLYSLAVMCFEMLCGSRPYQGKTPMHVALAHVRDPVPRISERGVELPPGLDDFFASAMAKDPAHRPQCADEFALRLCRALGDRRQM